MCMSLHGGHESYVASEIEKVNFKFYLIFIKFNLKKPHVATLLHGLTAPPPFSPSLLIWPLGPPLGGHTVTWVGSSLCQAHTHTQAHACTHSFTYPLRSLSHVNPVSPQWGILRPQVSLFAATYPRKGGSRPATVGYSVLGTEWHHSGHGSVHFCG